MAFKATRNSIVAILNTLTGVGQPLQSVFSYFDPQPQAYPCAMIRALGASSEIRLDSASNWLVMKFVIRVMVRTKNTQDGDDQLLDATDAILTALRSSTYVDTLAGAVEQFDIESIEEFEDQTDQPVVGFDITVAAGKIKAIA